MTATEQQQTLNVPWPCPQAPLSPPPSGSHASGKPGQPRQRPHTQDRHTQSSGRRVQPAPPHPQHSPHLPQDLLVLAPSLLCPTLHTGSLHGCLRALARAHAHALWVLGAAPKGPVCSTGPPSAPKLWRPSLGPGLPEGTITACGCACACSARLPRGQRPGLAQDQPQWRVDPGTAPTFRPFPWGTRRVEGGRDTHH